MILLQEEVHELNLMVLFASNEMLLQWATKQNFDILQLGSE